MRTDAADRTAIRAFSLSSSGGEEAAYFQRSLKLKFDAFLKFGV
jgi:hypothetical protein